MSHDVLEGTIPAGTSIIIIPSPFQSNVFLPSKPDTLYVLECEITGIESIEEK